MTFNITCFSSDPNTYGLSRVAQAVCDEPTLRLQNLQLVVNCIKHFYMVAQKQLVITSLPEVAEIAHDPAGGMYGITLLLIDQLHYYSTSYSCLSSISPSYLLFFLLYLPYLSPLSLSLSFLSLSLSLSLSLLMSVSVSPSSLSSPDKSLDELEKLIVLLLGCTIHSDNNTQLIAHITKKMGQEHQHALVFYIQKVNP